MEKGRGGKEGKEMRREKGTEIRKGGKGGKRRGREEEKGMRK